MVREFSFRQFLFVTAIISMLVATTLILFFSTLPNSVRIGGAIATTFGTVVLLILVLRRNVDAVARRSVAMGLLAIGSTCVWSIIGPQTLQIRFLSYDFLISTVPVEMDIAQTFGVLTVTVVSIALSARLMMFSGSAEEKSVRRIFTADWVNTAKDDVRNETKSLPDLHNRLSDELFVNTKQLVNAYIEPDIQFTNPSDYNEDNPISQIRTPVSTFLERFLNKRFVEKDGSHVLFVLSDAGMGKTSLLAMLAVRAINPKNWPKDVRIEFFKLGYDTISKIDNLKNKPNTVLLLDSLDEDQATMDGVVDRLNELIVATLSFRQVVISVRTQFFPTEFGSLVEQPGCVRVGSYRCSCIYLSPFSDEQVDEFLAKIYPQSVLTRSMELLTGSEPKSLMRATTVVKKMRSLRLRPMLLQYVDRLSARLDVNQTLNEYQIYDELICEWLDREERKPNGPSSTELMKACTLLALVLESNKRRAINGVDFQDFTKTVRSRYSLEKVEISGRSLVNKNSWNEWRFAHYSLQEFLLVRWAMSNNTLKEPNLPLTKRCFRATELMVTFLMHFNWVERKQENKLAFFDFSGTSLGSEQDYIESPSIQTMKQGAHYTVGLGSLGSLYDLDDLTFKISKISVTSGTLISLGKSLIAFSMKVTQVNKGDEVCIISVPVKIGLDGKIDTKSETSMALAAVLSGILSKHYVPTFLRVFESKNESLVGLSAEDYQTISKLGALVISKPIGIPIHDPKYGVENLYNLINANSDKLATYVNFGMDFSSLQENQTR